MPIRFRHQPLAVSPRNMRAIDPRAHRGRDRARQAGRPAEIWMKMNSLVDAKIIDALYEASQAGVEVDLVVRGICCLRPQVPGLSEQYPRQVDRRALPRAQPHLLFRQRPRPAERRSARLYRLGRLMPRNLDRRVETLVPLANPTVHEQVLSQIMLANMIDNQQSFEILARRPVAPDDAGEGRGAVQRPELFHDQSEPVGPFGPGFPQQALTVHRFDRAWPCAPSSVRPGSREVGFRHGTPLFLDTSKVV
jgi:polyphosphate kinase